MADDVDPNAATASGGATAGGSPQKEGPGSALVRPFAAIAALLWIVGLAILCIYSLTSIWPHPTPAGVTKSEDQGATATSGSTAGAAPKPVTASTGATGPTGAISASAGGPSNPVTPLNCASKQTPEEKEDCCLERATQLRNRYKGDKPLKDDPTCVYYFGDWYILWAETRLLLIILLCGYLGGTIHSLRSIFWYIGNRNLKYSWLAMYMLVPIVGSMLAFVFYLVFRGGLFSPTTNVSDTSPFGFAAVAALVGMFTNQAAEKLRSVFDSLMSKAQTGKDASARTTPVLGTATPVVHDTKPFATTTVTGDHFYSDSVVYANDAAMKTTFKNDKTLEAEIPAALIPNVASVVTLHVETPNGGKSGTVNLTVT